MLSHFEYSVYQIVKNTPTILSATIIMSRKCNFMARFSSVVITLLLSLFPVVSVAQTISLNGLVYTVNADGKTVTLKSYSQKLSGTLNIPSTVTQNGRTYTVTAIGTDAFLRGNSFLCSTIVLPSTVKTIGVSAFKNRPSIRNVIFSEGLEVIGAGAFEGARNLDNITLPKSLKTIQAHAFKNCPSLCNVTVLAPPAILSSDGCKGGEAAGRDHCDWFNSRNEDCQKLNPPQSCSHCSNPYLKVPSPSSTMRSILRMRSGTTSLSTFKAISILPVAITSRSPIRSTMALM